MNLNRSVARYIDCTLSILSAATAFVYASAANPLAVLSIIALDECAESSISRDLTQCARRDYRRR